MNQIYKKKSYVIFRVRDGYIVHNKSKMFSKGHTHITNFDTAKYLINLSIRKTIPKHLSDYLLESLIRISGDEVYSKKIQAMRERQKREKRILTQKNAKKPHLDA